MAGAQAGGVGIAAGRLTVEIASMNSIALPRRPFASSSDSRHGARRVRRGILSDQARSDRAGEIIDIRRVRRIVITQHITYSEHEALDQRIAVSKPR